MQRADINAGLIRQSCGQWKSVPELDKLVMRYGQASNEGGRKLLNKFKRALGK